MKADKYMKGTYIKKKPVIPPPPPPPTPQGDLHRIYNLPAIK